MSRGKGTEKKKGITKSRRKRTRTIGKKGKMNLHL